MLDTVARVFCLTFFVLSLAPQVSAVPELPFFFFASNNVPFILISEPFCVYIAVADPTAYNNYNELTLKSDSGLTTVKDTFGHTYNHRLGKYCPKGGRLMLTYPPDMYENKTSVDPEWRDTIFYFVANKTLENCRSTIDDALKVHGNVHHGKDGDTVTASSDCPAVILTPTNLGDKSVCPKVKVELEKKNFPADGLTFTTPSYYPQKTAALEPFTVRSQSDVNDLVRSVITVVPVKAGTTATEAVKISSDPSATPGTCEISRTLVENVPSRGNVINNPIFNSALLTYTITVGKSNETKPKPVPLPIHLSVPTLDSKLDLKLDFNNNAKGSLTSFDMNLVSEISFRQPKELKFVYTPVVNDNKTLDIEWRLEAETPLPTVAPPSCGTPSGEVTTMSTTTTTRGGVPNEVISAVLLIASIVYAFGSN